MCCAGNNQICEVSFVLYNIRHGVIAASFSLQRYGLNPTVVNVGFLVGIIPDGKVSVCAPPFPLTNYNSTNVSYQTSSRLVQYALYEATVSEDWPPPLKLLTQNLYPWWLANDATWIIHQSPCFCFEPSNHGFLELLDFKFHHHHHHHHYKSFLMTFSVTNFNAASAAAQFWLKILVACISSSRPMDFKLLTWEEPS